MIKNNKGFVITEVLILSTVIIGLLVFMFIQFKNINRSYQHSFKYDTVGGLYLANNIVNYINENKNYSEGVNYYIFDNLVEQLKNTNTNYIDITDCSYDLNSYCSYLIDSSDIEKILFTYEDTNLMDVSTLDEELKTYINNINTIHDANDYRIIVKYEDGTYATMRFNKGDKYVASGLIVYLDGINNTGYGHSNDTTTWKDLSGNNNDATFYNNPTWSNNSISFDGIDDYGEIGGTGNYLFSNNLTIEIRAKVVSPESNKNTMFIDNNSSENGASQYINSENKITTRIGIENVHSSISDNSNYNLNNYYTITTVYNTNSINLYIDGNLVNTLSVSGTYSISINPFNLARQASGIDYANVEFQNVLIYNRALSSDEVLRNYNVDMIKY